MVAEWSCDKTQCIKFDNACRNNVLHIKITNLEEGKLTTWKLDLLGIREKKLSVCEKVMEDIRFENNRYPFVSDNYNVSLNHLSKLKNKLSKSTDTLAKYDNVITEQLEHGVTEKVERISIPGKV